ncbi:MAG: thiamine biosynthesis protein ThiS [Nitrospirae bacterium]|nr:thiamine biosynthesis protein ThiS [Nitrospirota bacterium]
MSHHTRYINVRVVLPDGKVMEFDGPREVKAILRRLNILENTVLVVRDDELLTPDRLLEDGDTIELVPVISGGLN